MRSQIGRADTVRIIPYLKPIPRQRDQIFSNCRKLSADAAERLEAGNDAFQLAPEIESLGQIARGIYHENTVRHFALEHGAV
jgi:hypothetical protein